MFDKIFQGTYVGGNLSTAIKTRTKRGGAVIWGGIRDLEQIVKIEGINVYYRGIDPTGIGDVTMTGFNVPCRIGKATCLPATWSGHHLRRHLHPLSPGGRSRRRRGEEPRPATSSVSSACTRRSTPPRRSTTKWTYAMWQDFVNWAKEDPRAEEYRHLTWDEELEEAAKDNETNSAQVRL